MQAAREPSEHEPVDPGRELGLDSRKKGYRRTDTENRGPIGEVFFQVKAERLLDSAPDVDNNVARFTRLNPGQQIQVRNRLVFPVVRRDITVFDCNWDADFI